MSVLVSKAVDIGIVVIYRSHNHQLDLIRGGDIYLFDLSIVLHVTIEFIDPTAMGTAGDIYPILLGQNHTSGRTISKGAGQLPWDTFSRGDFMAVDVMCRIHGKNF